MIRHEVLTTEKVPFSYRVAGLGSRFLAWLIDFVAIVGLDLMGIVVGSVLILGRPGLGIALFTIWQFVVMWGYFLDTLRIPAAIAVAVIVGSALVFGLVVLAARVLTLRRHLLMAAGVVPAAWVALEYTMSVTTPNGAWSYATSDGPGTGSTFTLTVAATRATAAGLRRVDQPAFLLRVHGR